MRQEIKYRLTKRQYEQLKLAFSYVMDKDENNKDGPYTVNSIYFDDYNNSDYYKGINGVLKRKKHRIRYYNQDFSMIRFEKKIKNGTSSMKKSFKLKYDDMEKILSGEYNFLLTGNKLAVETYNYLTSVVLEPKVLVTYDREAFVLPYDDIRITFDLNLRYNKLNKSRLENVKDFYLAEDSYSYILEVKYNHFIPNFIKTILNTQYLTKESISKYNISRQGLSIRK